MKNKVININEMKDSRLLFDKTPPKFGYAIIIIISLFSVAAIIWSMFYPKAYVIQASGTITNQDANYVMCTYTGEITQCNMTEGMIVEEGDVLFVVKSSDYDIQEEQLLLTKETYETQIEKYELLVESIKDDVNYFDDSDSEDELYYSIYESYKSQIAQNTFDSSLYASYGYTDEQIEQEIAKNQATIAQIYYDTIQAAEDAISEATLQIESINAQLSSINSGQGNYEVKATSSGVLHMLAEYKDGMVVQTTQTVATITPQNSDPVICAYVSTSDMARIQENDTVQIVVDGLAQNVYGTISGTVESIDSDVTTQDNDDGTTTQVFKVTIKMDANYLISKSGDKVDVANGVATHAA